jgi:L-iditol 2-dehydrogenase
MRTSVLHGIHDVRLEERPTPRPGPDDVLVRVTAVGVCGSDVHYYEQGRIGQHVVTAPLVLGHEAGGVIEEVGSAVADRTVGQRVSIEPGVPCRACVQCLSGHYNLCPDVRFFATPPIDGAFTEYVVMPASFVYPVPDSLSDDAAALIEPLSVGVWACQRAGVGPGTRVLVTGAGPIGLLAAQVARARGAHDITVTDVSPARLAAAGRLGLRVLDVSRTPVPESGLTPDVLLECSGNPAATAAAIGVLAPAGRAVLIGMGGDTLTIPLSAVQDRELTLTGAFRYAGTWPAAIDLAASGAVDLDAIVTGHYPLEAAEEALTAPRRDPETVKPVVVP